MPRYQMNIEIIIKKKLTFNVQKKMEFITPHAQQTLRRVFFLLLYINRMAE